MQDVQPLYQAVRNVALLKPGRLSLRPLNPLAFTDTCLPETHYVEGATERS